MWRTILLYAIALALAAAALEWLEYRYLVRAFSTELYGCCSPSASSHWASGRA